MKKIFLILSVFTCISGFAGYDFDGQKVFFREGNVGYQTIIEMPGVKRSEFVLLDNNPSGVYGKDKKNVYAWGKIIPGVDPSSVQYLGFYMIKDKDFVYKGSAKLYGPDPATFVPYGTQGQYGHLYKDKFAFYDEDEKIMLDVYPNMQHYATKDVWLWDDKNVFVIPYFTTSIYHIPFLRIESMGSTFSPFYCVLQDGDVYCPLVLQSGDAQATKLGEENMDTFLKLYGQVAEAYTNDTYKKYVHGKVVQLIDTQEKREKVSKILKEKCLTEMKKGTGANNNTLNLLALIYNFIN